MPSGSVLLSQPSLASAAPGPTLPQTLADTREGDTLQSRRRFSFFVMVLSSSRRMCVEFTLAQTQEHFIADHQHAFESFGGVNAEVMVDFVPRHRIDH